MPERDWTVDPVTNRSNSSAAYLVCVAKVEEVIRLSAADLIAGRADIVARLVVSALAHKCGLAPRQTATEEVERL